MIFFDADEIEASRANQRKDQFDEILRMRKSVAEPLRNKFNILDFVPNEED